MVLSKEQLSAYNLRLLQSRARILCKYPFYGMLLMHLRYFIDTECETAYTDSKRIAFSPSFLDELSDSELDFVMMHEILHVVLMHCLRGKELNNEAFNIACDIVVNSNIMHSAGDDVRAITLKKYGESMHLAPDGREGYLFTAEEVYNMLPKSMKKPQSGSGDGSEDKKNSGAGSGGGKSSRTNGLGKSGGGGNGKKCDSTRAASGGLTDDHTRWEAGEDADELREVWASRLKETSGIIEILDPANGCGSVPLGAERLIKDLSKSKVNWRTLLHKFVSEEICDYSFSPPDRRFDGGDFYLPDYNDVQERIDGILFMIDTSGSMSDKMISAAYSEIIGALEQFGGRLSGKVGFFDFVAYEPKPFEDVDDILKIRPVGGGGTSFSSVFSYVRDKMASELPRAIIILTDGYSNFPPESMSLGIPVLWIINNREQIPPWGTHVVLELDE